VFSACATAANPIVDENSENIPDVADLKNGTPVPGAVRKNVGKLIFRDELASPCSAVIVSRKLALTARSCRNAHFFTFDASQGYDDLDRDTAIRTVANVQMAGIDLAVVKFDRALRLRPAAIMDCEPELGRRGRVVSVSNGQREVAFETYDGLDLESTALNVAPPFAKYAPTEENGTVQSACYDSGAPLFHGNNVAGVLTGPELGGACGNPDARSLYTPLWLYLEQIQAASHFLGGDSNGRYLLTDTGEIVSLDG
jgi:hypothetical protein